MSRYPANLNGERNLSTHTLAAYQRDIQKLQRWCAAQQLTLAQLNAHHLRQALVQQYRLGQSGKSLRRWRSALRSFFDYGVRLGWLKHHPASGLAAPKSDKKLPHTLDVDEVGKLLSFPDDGDFSARDRALLELTYSSGLRLAELAGLNLGDLADATVRVTGKDNKVRLLPVGRQAIAAVKHWLTSRTPMAAPGEQALFVSQRGTRISHRRIQQVFDHYHTCWNLLEIYALYKSFWGTPTLAPHKFITTWISDTLPRYTIGPTRARS